MAGADTSPSADRREYDTCTLLCHCTGILHFSLHICTASVSHSNCTATCHITINCSNILHNIIKLSVFKVSHCSALRTVLTFWYTRPKIYFRILLLFETVQISFLSELHYHETQLHSVSFREKDWRSFGLHIAQDGIVTTAKISPDLNHILWTIPDIWYCGQYLIFVADMAHVNHTNWMEFPNNWFVYFFGYAYTRLSMINIQCTPLVSSH